MKLLLPSIFAASALASSGAVVFDFANGLLFDAANPSQQVGTFVLTAQSGAGAPVVLTGSSPIQAFQIPGTTNIAIQGTQGDFSADPTISLTVSLTDPLFSIVGFNVASTSTVNGVPTGPGMGFNIGNTTGPNNDRNPADLGLSFNVDGVFTTPNAGLGEFVFDAVNSDISADGVLLAGQIAAADTLTSGNHSDDTFLFVSDAPIGNGVPLEATITSFDDNSIAGEAFRFDVEIVEAVPEPSSTALLGLGGLAFLARRKRK